RFSRDWSSDVCSSDLKTVATKTKVEDAFNKWANKKKNKAKYGNVISDINAYYKLTNQKAQHDNYLTGILRGSKFAVLPYRIGGALEQYAAANEAARENMLPRLQSFIESSYKDYHLPLEKELLAKQLGLYASKANYPLPELVKEIGDKNNNDFTAFVDSAFDASVFNSKESVMAFLQNPDVSK